MQEFLFKGINPTPYLRVKANHLLSRLLEQAPNDAKISGILEWDGTLFHCSIEIGSKIYPIFVSKNHRNAGIALDKAELSLSRKLASHGVKFQPENPAWALASSAAG